jgi:nitroreductase
MLLDTLKTRRSIRKFKDQEVEEEKREVILKSALLAPSSRSRRPWEFIVVTDRERLNKLSQCREQSSKFLAGAPLAVVVLADQDLCDVWIEDASIASAFIQLSAHDLGLGSCWIQVRERFHSEEKKAEAYIRELLEIPDQYSVECIIAIGYANEEKKPYEEEALPYEKIHYNQF